MLAATGPGCKSASVRVAAASCLRPAAGTWRPAAPLLHSAGVSPEFSSAPSSASSRGNARSNGGSAGLWAPRWASLAAAAMAARHQRRFASTSAAVQRRAAAEAVDPGDFKSLQMESEAGDASSRSASRVAQSMELLDSYSEESHPGHQPGRFATLGPEFDGMEFDGMRWRMIAADSEGSISTSGASSQALMLLSEQDRMLATKFEHEGGLGLCLNRAFTLPDRLRAEARAILRTLSGEQEDGDEEAQNDSLLDSEKVNVPWDELRAELGNEMGAVERAAVLLQAADIAEEREAVMRNTWSDIEFHGGESGNAELVERLEAQFAAQLVRTAEVRMKGRTFSEDTGKASSQQEEEPEPVQAASSTTSDAQDGIFDLALRDCKEAADLARRLPAKELTATLNEPRNIGVALDLVGVYLKNYEIDKGDQVLSRVVPLARKRGGTWLIKALDKLCAIRMKQFRAYDALVALQEIEQLVPFKPEEGWEFHDIMYRNFAWCYSSLDEAEKCLEYTRKSVEVKRTNGVPASWFDIWDLGKAHARLGQKTQQREEMKIGHDLVRKAGEIHRTAEASDSIMLAKILSNVGEVAMGIGDSFHLGGQSDESRHWYEQAEDPLRESYTLHATALGPLKPLAGWQAGTMAHCMVRLERWDEARDYLALALKVECTKDSTTNGSLIELLDRVMNCHQELGDLRGMTAYSEDLEQGLANLRFRGWDRRERDVFALLCQRISTAFLIADDGTGRTIPQALRVLQEAETNLVIFLGDAARPEDRDDTEDEL
ncbi:unnamed protein product, partial [Polarella glacialis]